MMMVMMVMVILMLMLFFFISTTVLHYFILMAYDLNVKVQPVSKYEQKPGKEEDGGKFVSPWLQFSVLFHYDKPPKLNILPPPGKYGAKIIRQPKRERDGTPHIKVPASLILI